MKIIIFCVKIIVSNGKESKTQLSNLALQILVFIINKDFKSLLKRYKSCHFLKEFLNPVNDRYDPVSESRTDYGENALIN